VRPHAPHRHLHGRAYVEHGVAVLRAEGGRVTKPRLAVLECLAEARRALAPGDVVAAVRAHAGDVDVDPATVYRILESFLANGLVHRVGPDGGYIACEHAACDVAFHLVMHCRDCDATSEIDLAPSLVTALRKRMRERARFVADEHLLQVRGRCAACAARAGVTESDATPAS
jgi:Fe2+ or Zn2+ uptake regulation protein